MATAKSGTGSLLPAIVAVDDDDALKRVGARQA
jgi:hypothetical protein